MSAGVVAVMGNADEAKQYLGLVSTVAIPALLVLFRTEQTAKQVADTTTQVANLHQENTEKLADNTDQLQKLTDVVSEIQKHAES